MEKGLAQYVLQKLPYVYAIKLEGILVVQYAHVLDTSIYNVYKNKMRCVLCICVQNLLSNVFLQLLRKILHDLMFRFGQAFGVDFVFEFFRGVVLGKDGEHQITQFGYSEVSLQINISTLLVEISSPTANIIGVSLLRFIIFAPKLMSASNMNCLNVYCT